MGKKSRLKKSGGDFTPPRPISERQPPEKSSSWLRWQVWMVALVGCLLYANTLGHEYAMDDMMVIRENQIVKKGISGIPEIMTTDAFYGFFGSNYKFVAGGRYRPLSLVSFAIEYDLWGLQPQRSHAINMLLYGLLCVVIFLCLQLMFKNRPEHSSFWNLPFIAALLYAAHPLHTEAVANIKGRDEIMGMLGSVATLYAVFRCIDAKALPAALIWGLMSVIFYIGALLSKENAITFLAVVPLSLYFFRSAEVFKRASSLSLMAMLVVIAAVYVYLRQKFTGVEITATTKEILNDPFIYASAAERFATISYSFLAYLRLLILPHPLTHDYYFNQVPILNWSSVYAWLGILVMGGLLIWAILQIRKRHVLAYCIFYFFITWSIVSNVLFTVGIVMNERFMFMPSLGFAIALGYLILQIPGLLNLGSKWSVNRMYSILIMMILIPYSAKTMIRNLDWKDDFSIFQADVKNSPNSAKVHNALGGELFTRSERLTDSLERRQYLVRAEKVLGRALEIYPNFLNALLLMGNVKYVLDKGNPEALRYYERALQLNPEYFDGNFNLARVYQEQGKYDRAVGHFKTAYYSKPQKFESAYYAAECYMALNNADSALWFLDRVAGLRPDWAYVPYKRGLIYGKLNNNLDEAIGWIERAISMDPTPAVFYEDLGVAYGLKGDPGMAIKAFERGIAQNPDYKPFYKNIGISYQQLGDVANAQRYFDEAARR